MNNDNTQGVNEPSPASAGSHGPALTTEEAECLRAAIRFLERSTADAADRARAGLISIYKRFVPELRRQ